MIRPVIDIESYHNLFSIAAVDYDSDETVILEITERQNDCAKIYTFLTTMKYFIGFNNIHYDSVMCNYFVQNIDKFMKMTAIEITEKMKQMNDTIINDNDNSNYRLYSKYKYNAPWINIDLFMYWSKMLRMSKKMSLKMFEVNLNWPRVQELPIHHNDYIKLEEIDLLLDYNMNDTLATKALALRQQKEINLRVEARKRYNFGTECLSWDGVKLGLNIIVARYAQRTGLDIKTVQQMRTVRDSVQVGNIILPEIRFREGDISFIKSTEEKKIVTHFKSFYGLHTYLKELCVTTTADINCRVLVNGNRYDVKSGGLHTYHNASIIIPGDNEIYRDIDVSSYYPTLGAMWNFIPEHLGKECAEELDSIRLERLELKASGKGKSPDAELLKLAMNGGFYGNTNNQYTPMFDMQCMLSITINGQLMLLMLCEELMQIGVKIDMCNTDGITILYDKSLDDQVNVIISDWEKLTRMQMESAYYTKVVRMNINNYLAFTTKDIKYKGMFLVNPPIDSSRDALVIPKALEAYFKDGKDPEEFIRDHTEIYDFCLSQKVDKKYSVWHNGTKQQQLNRYYIVKRGAYLYKSIDGVKMDNILKGYSVELFNNYEEKKMSEYNINYAYYITETKKLINELEPKQLSLL